MSDWNKAIIEEFRANDGKVGGMFAEMPLLLLHTTGAKSGQERVNPVAYGGAPTNPDWYYNLVANPQVSVEVGTEQFAAVATVADEPQRTELFNKMAAKNPGFAEYERTTDRVIPVVTLTRLP